MLIRSKNDPSIFGAIFDHPVDGWNAVKITMADVPYEGESPVGTLFNATPQCWDMVLEPSTCDIIQDALDLAAITEALFFVVPKGGHSSETPQ